MSSTLITNIKLLVNTREKNQLLRGKELAHCPVLKMLTWLLEDEIIAEYGRMEDLSTVNI